MTFSLFGPENSKVFLYDTIKMNYSLYDIPVTLVG